MFDIAGIFDEDYLYFYAERTGDAQSDADVELLKRLGELAPGMEVLDLACGTGRIANRLAGRGCRVTGLDTTPLFLDRARAEAAYRTVAVDYVAGDMRDLPWTARFDRVVCWFTAFGYFDDGGNRRVLTEVARALKPGGRLLLELIHYPRVVARGPGATTIERGADLLVDRHRLDPLTGRLLVERTIVRGGSVRRGIPWFVRLFTFTELRGWLLEAGFTGVTAYGEDGEPLAEHSSRMVVVADRPATQPQ